MDKVMTFPGQTEEKMFEFVKVFSRILDLPGLQSILKLHQHFQRKSFFIFWWVFLGGFDHNFYLLQLRYSHQSSCYTSLEEKTIIA